jgi:hypothetical protein
MLILGSGEAHPLGTRSAPVGDDTHVAASHAQTEDTRMWMTVNGQRFAMTLADTAAARALRAQLPLTLDMADLNRNEKHADLPRALPGDARRPGTLRRGDVMLYGTRTLVVFYETFPSSYAYTRLGRLDDPAALATLLGTGAARVSFEAE